MTATILDFLEGSPAARNTASLPMGGATCVAIWENRDDRISYVAPRGHVFSYYLDGGTGSYADQASVERKSNQCIVWRLRHISWRASPLMFGPC